MNLPDLSRIDRIGLDTEDTGVGFTDRPVGVSFALPTGEKGYARWGHEMGGNNCDKARVLEWIAREVDQPGKTVFMHSAPYDTRMIGYEMGRYPFRHAKVEDTGFQAALLNELQPLDLDYLGQTHLGLQKSGAPLYKWLAETFGGAPTRKAQAGNIWRAPGDIVEDYAEMDAVLTLGLGDFQGPQIVQEELAEVYALECSLLPMLYRMHMAGVRVDVDGALQLQKKLKKEHAALERKFFKEAGGEVNINSGVQLAALWDKLGIPYRMNPPTEKDLLKGKTDGRPSITKEDLENLTHPVGMMVRDLRRLLHYSGTFIDSYILENVVDGLIHGEFHPLLNEDYGTVSGRFSSGGALNLQNIPKRDNEWAPRIRGLYVPNRKGDVWLKLDYSQIEYRFLAHYAGGQLRARYNEDPDVDFHFMAHEIVGIPRDDAKHINFGIVYGMGPKKMAYKLGRTYSAAVKLLDEYHGRLPEVKKLYKLADRRAFQRGHIVTWGGRKRRFKKTKYGHESTHKALNGLLQGSAADLIKKAMVAIDKELDWEETPLHLTVHDELDFSVPRGMAKDFGMKVKGIMEDFQLTVPIRADAEWGPDWGHVSDKYLEAEAA